MSALLDLASRLRLLSDAELVRLLRLRGGNSAGVKDFFDLADWLLQPKHLDQVVNSLPKSALLHASGQQKLPDANPLLDFLAEQKLVSFEEVGFSQLAAASKEPGSDSTAGIHAFETLSGITELIFDLEHRILKEVGKQGIALADAKRLAKLTGKELNTVRAIFELAATAGLIVSSDSRWVLTKRAEDWGNQSQGQRWGLLAATWLELLGFGATELTLELENHSSLVEAIHTGFPLERFDTGSRFANILRYAELLGLSVDGCVTSWTKSLLRGELDKAVTLIQTALPKSDSRIIIQGDLSVIAPGPLATSEERELRAFVEVEQAGLASRYRLTALSVSFGMESGISPDAMRSTLSRLSGSSLPQPVEYLISDTAKRFGRIRVVDDGRSGGCFLISQDSTLITELANDVRLKPYHLIRVDSKCLASRFARDILYFGLRELGITAIRSDASCTPISPLRAVELSTSSKATGDWLETVQRLRAGDAEIVSSADDEAILRQILLAIKSKAKLEVTFLGAEDAVTTYTLEPSGVANGRMRARDRKADIERTIPLERITSVSFI